MNMNLYFLLFVLITQRKFTKASENDIILEYFKDKIKPFSILELELKKIFEKNKIEIKKIRKINTKYEKSFIIVTTKDKYINKNNLVNLHQILEKESKSFIKIRQNQIYKEKINDNNIPQRKLNFLKDEDYSKSDVLRNYLSTKYKFWDNRIKGKNVKVAIFDSGFSNEHSKCKLLELSNFTEEDEKDQNGHGTHITSLICNEIYGIAPEVLVYSYKVFDKYRTTTTSWLLQAMDKAQQDGVDIINFSFGGINFDDVIIAKKIEELISVGIIIVSSAGNDGPSQGTINFPGNLPYLITVGACDENVFSLSKISSRGPAIYKKNSLVNKPNTWAPGVRIPSIDHNGIIQFKSGSSISTAIVTGYISLLLSKFNDDRSFINMGSLMLFIKESNLYLPGINLEEIPSGLFNPDGLFKITEYYVKNKDMLNLYILNNVIDFTYDFTSSYTINQDYKDKYAISFYSSMQPIYFNLILVNPLNIPITKINLSFEKEDLNRISPFGHHCVKLEIDTEEKNYFILDNHFGVLPMKIFILNDAKCRFITEKVKWNVFFQEEITKTKLEFHLAFDIIPTPSRYNRILLDRFHNLFYPFDGYVAKDDLLDNRYSYDWNYESFNTNYLNLYYHLREKHYFVEESHESLDCINLSEYSVLILLDEEKSLKESEITRLKYEYEENHLSIFIIAEWNDPFYLNRIILHDDETFEDIEPISLGAEFFSLNNFLDDYGIKLGHDTLSYEFEFKSYKLKLKSSCSIVKFPAGSIIYGNYLRNDEYLMDFLQEKSLFKAVLGLVDQLPDKINSGRMAVFTDSYCVDDYQMKQNIKEDNCFWMISSILKFLIHGKQIKNQIAFLDHKTLENDYHDKLLNDNLKSKDRMQIINELEYCTNLNFTDKLIIPEDYSPFKHKKTEKVTNDIENLINENSFNIESENLDAYNYLEVIENILYVFVPILSIIFFLGMLVRCKRNSVARMRYSTNISYLKTTHIPSESDQLNDSTSSSTIIINSLV